MTKNITQQCSALHGFMKFMRFGVLFAFLVSIFLVLPVQTVFAQTTGNITGTVRGPGGTGLEGVLVYAINVANVADYTAVTTAADGTYTITGRTPGSYMVFASSLEYSQQYYNHADSYSTATSVTVTSGGTVSNINFDLVAGGNITGTVRGPGGTPLQGVSVVAYTWGGGVAGSATTAIDGTYTITGRTPGSYTVFASSLEYAQQYYNHADSYSTATPVTVTSGGTTSNINFDLVAGGNITGTVRGPGGTPLANISVIYDNGNGVAGGTITAADGTYTIMGLIPGSYKVSALSLGYAQQYYNHADSADTATAVTVTGGSTVSNINFDLIAADYCYVPVKVNTNYFSTVQAAYNAAANGNIIQISAMVFNEDILLNRDITTIFSGGYDCGYSAKTGYSTVDGTVTFKAGSVTVDGLIIK